MSSYDESQSRTSGANVQVTILSFKFNVAASGSARRPSLRLPSACQPAAVGPLTVAEAHSQSGPAKGDLASSFY